MKNRQFSMLKFSKLVMNNDVTLRCGVLILLTILMAKMNAQTQSTFTDARDGNVYKTVTIGSQLWMAENLKYLPNINKIDVLSENVPCYYVYDYKGAKVLDAKTEENYNNYGVLYNGIAAKTACPVGWHLPSDADWIELSNSLGGNNDAGGNIKDSGTTHWKKPNFGATNKSGFTALPGGYHLGTGKFMNIKLNGAFWSSTKDNAGYYWYWVLSNNKSSFERTGISSMKAGFSVRCVKNKF